MHPIVENSGSQNTEPHRKYANPDNGINNNLSSQLKPNVSVQPSVKNQTEDEYTILMNEFEIECHFNYSQVRQILDIKSICHSTFNLNHFQFRFGKRLNV